MTIEIREYTKEDKEKKQDRLKAYLNAVRKNRKNKSAEKKEF